MNHVESARFRAAEPIESLQVGLQVPQYRIKADIDSCGAHRTGFISAVIVRNQHVFPAPETQSAEEMIDAVARDIKILPAGLFQRKRQWPPGFPEMQLRRSQARPGRDVHKEPFYLADPGSPAAPS